VLQFPDHSLESTAVSTFEVVALLLAVLASSGRKAITLRARGYYGDVRGVGIYRLAEATSMVLAVLVVIVRLLELHLLPLSCECAVPPLSME